MFTLEYKILYVLIIFEGLYFLNVSGYNSNIGKILWVFHFTINILFVLLGDAMPNKFDKTMMERSIYM